MLQSNSSDDFATEYRKLNIGLSLIVLLQLYDIEIHCFQHLARDQHFSHIIFFVLYLKKFQNVFSSKNSNVFTCSSQALDQYDEVISYPLIILVELIMHILYCFLHATAALDVLQHYELEILKLILRMIEFVLYVKLKDPFCVVSDSPHMGVLEVGMHSNGKESV